MIKYLNKNSNYVENKVPIKFINVLSKSVLNMHNAIHIGKANHYHILYSIPWDCILLAGIQHNVFNCKSKA